MPTFSRRLMDTKVDRAELRGCGLLPWILKQKRMQRHLATATKLRNVRMLTLSFGDGMTLTNAAISVREYAAPCLFRACQARYNSTQSFSRSLHINAFICQ